MRIRCLPADGEEGLEGIMHSLTFQVFSFTMKCWQALTGGGGLDECE